MQEPLNKNEIIEKIARQVKCTACGRRHRPNDFDVLEETETMAVMRITCRECRKESIIMAVVQRRRVRPVYTELDPEEWERFRDAPPLTPDDVINIHRAMKEYVGDLTDVLEDPLPPEDGFRR